MIPNDPEIKSCILDLKKIREESKSYYYYEYPDIYVYEVTNKIPNYAVIFSIEKFIKPFLSNVVPEKIISIGLVHELGHTSYKQMQFKLSKYPYDKIKIPNHLTGEGHILTNSYYLEGQSMIGTSGAPVFYLYNNKGEQEIIFAGVISSHIPQLNITTVVKPTEVIKFVDSIINLSSKLN